MAYEFFIDSWDSNQPGARWDTGLQWDVNIEPAFGNVQPYLDLITSEHKERPRFMAMVEAMVRPYAENIETLRTLYLRFDVELAAGAQLDVVGEWVGVSRKLALPLTGVYFALDTFGVGFDEGTWRGPFDPDSYLIDLPDDSYRLLINARIANNQWDGTIPGAYAIWDQLFAGTNFELLIQDYGNMHMLYAILGPVPDAVTLALFTGGYLNNRPSGVMVDGYMVPSVDNTPYFGFDVQNSSIAGFDTGAWGTKFVPE